MVFSTFTDSLSSNEQEKKLKASARVITMMLKNWTGMLPFCCTGNESDRTLMVNQG